MTNRRIQHMPSRTGIAVWSLMTAIVIWQTVSVGRDHNTDALPLGVLASLLMLTEVLRRIARRSIVLAGEELARRIMEQQDRTADDHFGGNGRTISCYSSPCDGVRLTEAEMPEHLRTRHGAEG